MRVFLGSLLVLVAAILVSAGLIAPVSVSAQQAATQNLPSTHFGSEGPVSPHGFNAAPGFAHAPIPDNPDSPGARAVGQPVCSTCHSQATKNFAPTLHAPGMDAALAAAPRTAPRQARPGP